MVEVEVGQSNAWQFLLSKLGLLNTFYDGTVLEPSGAILGSTPASQLGCQDDQEMSGATSYASVVALRRLGYTVTPNDLGAQIFEVSPHTPAAAAGVQCNDLITAVDGVAVHSADDLVNDIRSKAPGDMVHLTVRRNGSNGSTQTVQIAATLSGTPALDGQPAAPKQPFLGVEPQTYTTYSFPFDVNIDVGAIGGPSAGLAMTLGLLDSLSNGQLTGGHRIAATGTIDLQGAVGDVGGVAQKTVAVRRAGAQVFFVPVQEYSAAKSEAGSMKVYAVSTLAQALSDLQAMGGQIPPANGTG
jgi:PDZ domain-containing protein